MAGYESRNRCSFSRFQKVRRDGTEVTSTEHYISAVVPDTIDNYLSSIFIYYYYYYFFTLGTYNPEEIKN